MNNKRIDYHPPFYNKQFYHVYNKTVSKDLLFYTDENYSFFLRRYSNFLKGLVDTYAFCLLPNPFHLLLKPITDDFELISQQFRKFFISYSMAINKQQDRKGNLFQKNFKRIIILDEKYLMSVIYYIHLNPLHHKIQKDFENYPYSSYKIIIDNKSTQLKRKEVLDWFGGNKQFVENHKEFKRYVFDEYYSIEE